MPRTIFLAALLLLSATTHADAFQCSVCHSKNPAMVKMHKELQAKEIGCFSCHRIGEKLMGKGQPKDRSALLKRRGEDLLCTGCHNKPQEISP